MNASRVDSDSSRHTGWVQGLLPAAALRVCPRTPRPHEPVSETQECLWVLTAGLAKSCYRSCFLVWMFFVLNVLKNCFQVWLKHLFPCSPVTGRFPACLSSSPLQRGGLVGQRGAETCPRPASVLGCHGRLVYSCTLSSASGPRTQASLSTNLSIMSVRSSGVDMGPAGNLISLCVCQAPVFLLFLDTTWQLLEQCPAAFEFSETYLAVLHDSTRVALFGTFLFNSPHQRVQQSTVSTHHGNVQ